MLVGHHSIIQCSERMYILSVSTSVLKVWVKYTNYGNEQPSIESKEDTVHLFRYPLINRQSKRDRRYLKKIRRVIMIMSVGHHSITIKWKIRIYFRWVQVS